MILKEELVEVFEETGTIGGSTYWVVTTDHPEEERAYCYRHFTKKHLYPEDARCSRAAGWGTDHFGQGACKFHGGVVRVSARIKDGRKATQTKKSLKYKIDAFMADDAKNMYDLTYELAAMRVMVEEFSKQFPLDPEDENFTINMQRMTNLIASTGTLVDKISRIEARNSITSAQLVYLRARLADILLKYIPDVETRQLAVQELADSIPGAQNDSVVMQIYDGKSD